MDDKLNVVPGVPFEEDQKVSKPVVPATPEAQNSPEIRPMTEDPVMGPANSEPEKKEPMKVRKPKAAKPKVSKVKVAKIVKKSKLGRGHKVCPKCGKATGPRAFVCQKCGHKFQFKDGKPQSPKAKVGRVAKVSAKKKTKKSKK